MPATRFCSECGDPVKVKRAASLPLRAFCAACSPRFNRAGLSVAAVLILSLTMAFFAGRATGSREPFYIIGTPVDPLSDAGKDRRAEASDSTPSAEAAPGDAGAPERLCGAPTRSGRPCRRKVKGGDPCWQHKPAKR